MSAKDKEVYTSATEALKARLDSGARTLAAQDVEGQPPQELGSRVGVPTPIGST